MIILKDSSIEEILEFLDKVEVVGDNISTVIAPQIDMTGEAAALDPKTHKVSFEARQLKMLFLKLHSV